MCINYNGSQDANIIKETLEIAERLDALKESPNHETYVQVRPALKILGGRSEVEIPNIKHPLLKLTRYKFFGASAERTYDKCEAFHFAPFVWQDGDVDVCGYHRKDERFNLGNVYELGEKGRFRYIMKNAPQVVDVVDNCQVCCKLNSENTAIARARKLRDINFP